ncbi:MAG: methyltransferase [Bryobacterales bacterium]|nr:acetylserotonin O-methyltransferase [Bryobacteraceae bacterium]MDW8129755.1 methyltransferase [Bryobacterales bacterium]
MEPVPEHLLERLNAFRESRLLLTAIELDVFTAVGEGSTATETAARVGTALRSTEMLLDALVAVGLLGKREDRYFNVPASRWFRRDTAESARDALMHIVKLWERWSRLTACVRKGSCVRARRRTKAETEAFIALMHYNARWRAPLVAEAIGLEGVGRMLDLGGGSGAYAIAFAQAAPSLEADVMDLAPVLRIARRHIEQAGVGDRVKTKVGDLRQPSYGAGYDLVFISAVCHMLDPQENRAMLRKSHAALHPGGRVVIQDFILEPDRTAPRHAALFALNMLVNTPGGATYTETEYRQWLEEAGFYPVRRLHVPGPTGLMVGWRLI